MGELIARKRKILLNEPHSVTETDWFVNFETDVVGLMEITGNGYIYSAGSNLFNDSKRYSSGTSLYIGANGSGYEIYLKSGYYTFSADIKNNEYHDLYVRSSTGTGASLIWSKASQSKSKFFQLSTTGLFRFNFYDSGGINAANIGNCWLNYGKEPTDYEPYKGTYSQSTTRKMFAGINNVWAENGQVTVKYWKH